MDRGMGLAAFLCATMLFLAAVGIFVWNHIHTLRIFRGMEDMLEAAFRGDFSEFRYDESRMSALEVRMCQYLKEQEGQRRRLGREQEEIHALLSDISHQTKTPIANLLLYSQLLQERLFDPESRKIAGQLVGQAEKLRFLTDSLFKASRLEHGMIVPSPGTHRVSELLAETAAQGKAKAARRGIEISWKVQEESDCAFFDEKWTAEAIYNILDNAVK